MLLEEDQTSSRFPHLAMEILNAGRQSKLDVSHFTDDEATQLIELIEERVRNPWHRI